MLSTMPASQSFNSCSNPGLASFTKVSLPQGASDHPTAVDPDRNVSLNQCPSASNCLACPRIVILDALESVEETKAELDRLRQRHPALPIILSVDGQRQDLPAFLTLGADDIHDSRSGEEMLGHRIQHSLRTHSIQSHPMTSRLAEEECAVWSSLFNSAGTGLLKGRSMAFMQQSQKWAERAKEGDEFDWTEAITDCLKAVTWELNNTYATQLLGLQEPVSLSSSFLDRLTPTDPETLGRQLSGMMHDQSAIRGDFELDIPDGANRFLSIEITVPANLNDVLLMTIIDITQQANLEIELRKNLQMMEERVDERTRAIRIVNHELEKESHQRQRLTQQVRENLVHITQGIISAKKILEVALTGKDELRRVFPEAIMIERPMDIMGGDFIFTQEREGRRTLALIDSTGHGIPGAMVSLMGSTMINKAFASLACPNPSDVLDLFHTEFSERMLNRSGKTHMYGYDAGILTLDEKRNILEFAGARGDLYLVRDGETQIFRGTRGSIEVSHAMEQNAAPSSYALHTIQVLPGDQFYMITDGVRDQFGGSSNRKLGRKRLADILARNGHLPPVEREKAIQHALLIWKGANAKVDDATLVGIQC